MKMQRCLMVLFFLLPFFSDGQTLTELAVPRYFGSKSSGSINNERASFGVCLQIDNLLPNTVYDVKGGIGLVADPPTTFGAGTLWNGTSYSSSRRDSAFTTDVNGCSGPFWLFFQPTGNSVRFDAGQVHNLRLGFAVTGGSIPGIPAFVGGKTLTALDIAPNPRTPEAADDGAFLKGTALPAASGKYILLFDNISGNGDPLFIYQVRQSDPVQTTSLQDLPEAIRDIYMQGGSSAVGDYPALIPAGSANPAGVRRIEARNDDNTLYAFHTDDDGIWPSGGNTAGAIRRELVCITVADAPLVPGGPVLPSVLTDSLVTAITSESATSGGVVVADGGDSLTVRGLCWSLTQAPDTADSHAIIPGNTGPFTHTMTGLLPNTTYYYRAFATNQAGTAYGSQYVFHTLCVPLPPVPEFTADDTSIFTGDTVNFFDSTTFCPDTWKWSFVGGIPMSSTIPNPTGVVFHYPGDFNICLTVTNSYGTRLLCKQGYISVRDPVVPRVVITEIMYNPPESGTDSLEFIEMYNYDTVAVNLKNFSFSSGVTFTFPDYLLSPGEYVVSGKNDSALYRTFGIQALRWSGGSLSNSGELIVLKDSLGQTVDSVEYDDKSPWDPQCAGGGYSLELCDPGADNSLAENWRASLGFTAVNADGDTLWAHPGAGCLSLPVADFIASDTTIITGGEVQFTNLSSGDLPMTFEWVFDGGSPGSFCGETPPPVAYTFPGMYDVSLSATNEAGTDVQLKKGFIEVGFPSGTADCSSFFSICPNPVTRGKINILFPVAGQYELIMVGITGQPALSRQMTGPSGMLDVAGRTPGLYLLRITDKDSGKTGMQKIVIQ
ncbi:MAG TPA: lamin tail domain-containing protein [Bacteroidales bacterium]|nr:lamin tail domain-containing protein [Bacteroidales bacterium]